jgi:hypothetical protein
VADLVVVPALGGGLVLPRHPEAQAGVTHEAIQVRLELLDGGGLVVNEVLPVWNVETARELLVKSGDEVIFHRV